MKQKYSDKQEIYNEYELEIMNPEIRKEKVVLVEEFATNLQIIDILQRFPLDYMIHIQAGDLDYSVEKIVSSVVIENGEVSSGFVSFVSETESSQVGKVGIDYKLLSDKRREALEKIRIAIKKYCPQFFGYCVGRPYEEVLEMIFAQGVETEKGRNAFRDELIRLGYKHDDLVKLVEGYTEK